MELEPRKKCALLAMMLPILVQLFVASFVLAPPHKALMPARSVITMQENPLAKFFGGDGKSKKKGGALSNGLDELTRNAPLPVKLAVGMLKPLVGILETAIAEGQADADEMLFEAQNSLRLDSRATAMLGSDITIGPVFSSASSNVNGMKAMQLQCQCTGTAGTGVIAIRGSSDGTGKMRVETLSLQAGGRVIEVPTLRGGKSAGGRAGAASRGPVQDSDRVIDVEATPYRE